MDGVGTVGALVERRCVLAEYGDDAGLHDRDFVVWVAASVACRFDLGLYAGRAVRVRDAACEADV
jgi:hypothetical protein